MRDLRWRAAGIKVCDILTGGLLTLTLVYGSGWYATGALLTLLVSVMLDVGEPGPRDP